MSTSYLSGGRRDISDSPLYNITCSAMNSPVAVTDNSAVTSQYTYVHE